MKGERECVERESRVGKMRFWYVFQFCFYIFGHLFSFPLFMADGMGIAEAVVKEAEVAIGGEEGGGAKTKTITWTWNHNFWYQCNLQLWGDTFFSLNSLCTDFLSPVCIAIVFIHVDKTMLCGEKIKTCFKRGKLFSRPLFWPLDLIIPQIWSITKFVPFSPLCCTWKKFD